MLLPAQIVHFDFFFIVHSDGSSYMPVDKVSIKYFHNYMSREEKRMKGGKERTGEIER